VNAAYEGVKPVKNIYYMDRDSSTGRYAEAFITDTWITLERPHSVNGTCSECERGLHRLVPPYRLEDEGDGVTSVGDCSWHLSMCVVTEECAKKLQSAHLSLEYVPVDVVRFVATRRGGRRKNIFAGRKMFVIRATGVGHLDAAKSGFIRTRECSLCHQFSYEPIKLTDLVVDRIEPHDANCFTIEGQESDFIHVAEDARNRILDLGLTNMWLTLAGKLA
jgi:hypothetical protein